MEELNKTYNNLTVKEYIEKPNDLDKYQSWNSSVWVRCECSCGETDVRVPLNAVKKGYIKSCGCLRKHRALETLNECRGSTHNECCIEFDGETHNVAEWSRITGIPRTTIMYRLSKELPIEKVFERKDEINGKNTTISK